MFTAKMLRQRMQTVPFRPFRVFLSDGTSHDVMNHDAAWVEKTTFDIGLNVDADGFAEDVARLLNPSHNEARRPPGAKSGVSGLTFQTPKKPLSTVKDFSFPPINIKSSCQTSNPS